MEIIKCHNQIDYNKNKPDSYPGDFLQSWVWGEIQDKNNYLVTRYLITSKGSFSVISKPLFFGLKYWYISRGPLLKKPFIREESLEFLRLLKKEARKNNIIFIRIEPNFSWPSGFKVFSTLAVQPFKTLVLDLKKDKNLLLSEMSQKTRYNIRLAEKKGLILRMDKKYFSDFWRLMQDTSRRDNFKGHSEKYYKNLLTSENIYLLTVFSNNQVIAAGIFAKFGQGFYYLHGASDHFYRQKMAPYFLQWQAISWAQDNNCLFYDFYGIDENKWPGVTRFKLGFGGKELEYTKISDIAVYKLVYIFYRLLRKFKKYL